MKKIKSNYITRLNCECNKAVMVQVLAGCDTTDRDLLFNIIILFLKILNSFWLLNLLNKISFFATKGGARAPSAPPLDPPQDFILKIINRV